MKKQPKQKEIRRAKKIEIPQKELYDEEKLPEKDKDGVDIINSSSERLPF